MGVSRKACGHCLQTFLFGVELDQNRLKKFLEKSKKKFPPPAAIEF